MRQRAIRKDKTLQDSKNETEEVVKQVLQIWAKMKADEQEGGKRKTGEEGAGGANKKAKIACDIVASSCVIRRD
ncbi:hypothetical protein N0V91_003298 [Didymella pomorum]|uniref:Uncharacterized protein n=1 Tax=Didymella pomorum TaxID=749634 RepID=A0A9W8ZHQ0_9PLEO|nr:hypothetical protein N0V91_003298 [Didymella pomorum]